MADGLEDVFANWPERNSAPRVFRLGDAVRIKSGPLASFTGRVEGINQAKSLLKVKVSIFGQEKPLKLGFAEVEKVRES